MNLQYDGIISNNIPFYNNSHIWRYWDRLVNVHLQYVLEKSNEYDYNRNLSKREGK